MSALSKFFDAVNKGQVQLGKAVAAAVGAVGAVGGQKKTSAKAVAPQTNAMSAAPAAALPDNEVELLAEKKSLENKLKAGSYPGEDADRYRLDEINERLEALAATQQAAKPAPLPPDEQNILNIGGPDALKSYQEGKARGAERDADRGPEEVKAGPVRGRLIEMPPAKGVNLASATQGDQAEIIDRGSGKKETVKRSAIWNLPNYVNNAAQKMEAQPVNLATLEVKTMTFTDSGGASFEVDTNRIVYGAKFPALTFERRGKFIYPLDETGNALFDTVNTPIIVAFAKWMNAEVERYRKLRLKLTETTFMFQVALATLATAANAPEMGGEFEPYVPKRGGQTPPSGKPTGGGEPPAEPQLPKNQETTGAANASGSPAPSEPTAGGGAGGGGGQTPVDPAASTPQAPPQRPAQGGPLDSTPPVAKNQDTVATSSGGSSGSSPPSESSSGSPPRRLNTLEPKNLPKNQQITINTPKGPKQMTVGEYRRLVDDANKWIGSQRYKGIPEQQLVDQATEKFGLNKHWRSIDNPYVY